MGMALVTSTYEFLQTRVGEHCISYMFILQLKALITRRNKSKMFKKKTSK